MNYNLNYGEKTCHTRTSQVATEILSYRYTTSLVWYDGVSAIGQCRFCVSYNSDLVQI